MKERKYTNIIDYINWRGDLSFDASPFNEVDAAIFARFSYMDLKNIVLYSAKGMSLKNAYQKYARKKERRIYWELDPELFKKMSESKRYQDLILSFYIERNNAIKVEQFSALTISIRNDLHFVSYRGTDSTVNGWKEDLMMTFDESVPSQEEAKRYLKRVSNTLEGDFYIGGHSKGGNLSVYASLMSDDTLTNRIKGVYSFDGPGLHKNILEKAGNKKIVNSIYTYIPQSSVFGRMLNHSEQMLMVHSASTGLLQHDLYSWTVMQKTFDLEKDNTAFSRVFETTFQDYLSNLTRDDRKKVVDVIFNAIAECGEVNTIEELAKGLMFNLLKVVKHLSDLERDDQALISEAIKVLGGSFVDSLSDEIKSRIPRMPFIDVKKKTEK